MRISWKYLTTFVDLSAFKGPRELAELLTARGLEVEAIHFEGKGLEKVITAQILEQSPHPQADRLSLCRVICGDHEPLEIVCGAQNMKAGDKVALAMIGAQLPNGMKIASSKIRGVVSHGMLCSETELGFKEESEGIFILPPETPVGKPLSTVLGLDDVIFTLKLTANRGDCLSHLGIAREIGAALRKQIQMPVSCAIEDQNITSAIPVSLDAGAVAPQFLGCLVENVQIAPSPPWLVKGLEKLGVRPINNIVDATNWVMLELGHPLHAYDADFIEGQEIHVRFSKSGEQLPLLDGRTIGLDGSELVIADSKRAIALAGVMGGANSEVRSQTHRLFLECAEFDPVLVRQASTRHQRHTEAAHRFERGVDPQGLSRALGRLVYLIQELAGGVVRDVTIQRLFQKELSSIQVQSIYFSNFLGMSLSEKQVEEVLLAHECRIQHEGKDWLVTPPSYRFDLTIQEDLAEEVARALGYDQIPSTIPKLTSQPVTTHGNPAFEDWKLKERAKSVLAASGLMETINFAFTSQAWLKQLGFTGTAQVMNPLSEEHEVLVPSLLPGLLKNVLENEHHHFGSESLAIRLFELRPTFFLNPEAETSLEKTPIVEKWKLAFVLSGPRYAAGLKNDRGEVDFYDLKALIESLALDMELKGLRYLPWSNQHLPHLSGLLRLLHPGQSVEILAGNLVAGGMGLLHPLKVKELKMRSSLWIGELDWEIISQFSSLASQPRLFQAWPEFPSMERDFALVVGEDVTADRITQVALKAGKPLAQVAKIFDVYRGAQVPKGMTSVAVRVIFYNKTRSLQESETEAVSAQILSAWKKELGADLRM